MHNLKCIVFAKWWINWASLLFISNINTGFISLLIYGRCVFLELDSLYSRFWFPKDLGRISKAMSCKLLPHLDQGTSCMFRSPRSPSLAPPNPRLNPPAPANWSTPTCLTARAPVWWIRVTVSVLRSPTIHGSELFEWGSYPVCFFSHHLFLFFQTALHDFPETTKPEPGTMIYM